MSERRLFTFRGQTVYWRGLHVHAYTNRVLPDGSTVGVAQLAFMAATGKVPYRCRCGEVRFL